MNGWFLAYVFLQILGLGIHTGKHGEKTEVTYNFWTKLVASLIGVGIVYMAIKSGF